jgi:branched-chain amino acid transport system permease protein
VNAPAPTIWGTPGRSLRQRVSEAAGRSLAITGSLFVVLSVVFIAQSGAGLYWKRLLNGLWNGSIYAAVALALVLIFKATGVINFAQGNMAMFGTFVAYVLSREQKWPVWLSIVVAMALSAVGAAIIERVLIRPFDPGSHLPITIVTLALFNIVGGVAFFVWFADPKPFPSPFPARKDDYVTIFGARVFYVNVGILLSVVVTAIFLTLLLKRTKVGLAFRAVSSNLESSRLVGVHVGRTLQFGWALAAAIGTLAGCLVVSDPKNFIDPGFMSRVLVFAFAAATIGGLDSLVGAVVGGLLVGEIQTMVGGYVSFIGSELTLAATLVVIVIVLLVKPTGLFGSRKVERV